MKLTYAIIAIILISPLCLSSETWELDSDLSITFTQSAYSDSWAGTELGNIAWMGSSISSAEKQLKSWLKNTNTLKLAFGQTHLQKLDSMGDKYWEKPDKSTDKIDFETLFRFTTRAWVDPFVAGRLESQFLDLSDPALTRMVNPLLLTETAGVIRTFIENDADVFTTRLGAAFRENLDKEALQSSGKRELTITVDGGLEAVSEYKHSFAPMNASFKSRLQLYQALFNSKSEDLNEDWKSPDMVWENVFTTKLWGLLSATLSFEARYEKEAVHELQWKQLLGLGFSYSLM
ncbi:MAG: hypothetical protein PHY48_02415 [Candidatus Cloacimonetes bacterium]|nr:hypothetical protein [Candidatus Cloacimonadota bacterium]